ncbi:hypothetical protein AGMMS50225_06840 [Betaproteobacteria bacterium]|nr:hypothetical protein AGMMS50225_06840 [Betaproteobacteria bacterium]
MTVKGMQIEVRFESSDLVQKLNSLSEALDDTTPVMQDIGALIKGRVSDRFETESDPRGIPWAPWAPATKKTYPKDGNRRILDRRGDMLDSLSWETDRNSVTVGFGAPYAAYHEFGTTRMPRRSLLFDNPETGTLTPDDEAAIENIITGYLRSALD